MTPEERAKNCLPGCYDPQGRKCSADETCEIHFRVALEIKAACDEVLDKQRVLLNKVAIDEAEQYGHSKGFAYALEKAGELAAFHSGPSVQLVEKIRKLTPAGQEK